MTTMEKQAELGRINEHLKREIEAETKAGLNRRFNWCLAVWAAAAVIIIATDIVTAFLAWEVMGR